MGRFLMLLLVCGLILAVLKAALIALLAAFLVALFWGFLVKPIETIAFLLLSAWMTLMQTHTLLGLLTLGFSIFLALRGRPPLEAPDGEAEATHLLPPTALSEPPTSDSESVP